MWSFSKTYLSVRMSKESFGRLKSFTWLFGLIRSKIRGHGVAVLSLDDLEDVCLETEISGDLF